MAEEFSMDSITEETNSVTFYSRKYFEQQRLSWSDIIIQWGLEWSREPIIIEKEEHIRIIRGV